MSSKKYRSYGVRRENNLSDLDNTVEGLDNILNNLPGVGGEVSFISQDLDAIRGLKNTTVANTNFIGLAGSSPRYTVTDEFGNTVLDTNGNPVEQVIEPIYRVEDRFKIYRNVTEDPPVFNSGSGPYAYFIPSNLLPTLAKGNNLNNVNINTIKSSPAVEQTDDFWALGEFIINDKFRTNYTNNFGGILWEGYYIPNPNVSTHGFAYKTTGLFHVEYDRFSDNNWEVVKSIYAKVRQVTVGTTAVSTTTIQLSAGESRYISTDDFLQSDPTNKIVSIVGDLITLTNPISAASGSSLSFDMNLGEDRYTGTYIINEILDRAETPQIKKRIFWWFPSGGSYNMNSKYLRNYLLAGNYNMYPFYNWNKEASSPTSSAGSIRNLLENSITPFQQTMGSAGNYRQFKSSVITETIYTPKSSFAEINKNTTSISFDNGSRYIQGTFSSVDSGNIIIPQTPASLGSIIPKNLKIKDVLGVDSPNIRIVNQAMTSTQTSVPVYILDHLGLIDYFVASSTTNVVTVSSTANLKKDMICITGSTLSTSFVRITEIISSTQFRTSANLGLTSAYVFIYSNSGILDRSMETFCTGVFGQVLAAGASSGSNVIQLVSAAGVTTGQVVQFNGAIPAGTTVTLVSGTNITLSANLTASINISETVVFAPSGTSVNKEICVLPLDLSPPFVGVNTGLDTNSQSIKGMRPQLNVKVDKLTINNATVNTSTAENYDRRIAIGNGTYTILAKVI